jgi:hypothetical protein
MSLIGPNLIKLECLFNPDIINLANGVKFTTKIKGCKRFAPSLGQKVTTDGINKDTTDNEQKIIA